MKKITLLLLTLVICLAVSGQKNKSADSRFTGLDQQLEKYRNDWKAAGFAVAVLEKGRIVYARGFGYRDLEKQVPVTPQTLFAIGSCTKAFTSALIGLEKAAGKADLDQPVRDYLPSLVFYKDELNLQATLRDLMSHRTGIPRHDYSWYLFSPGSSRDSLLARIKYQEPATGLREQFLYNNFMYMALGAVEEKLTGIPWEQNVKEKLLTPLGMNRTTFTTETMQQDADFSYGYRVWQDSVTERVPYFRIGAMAPAGALNSSVTEMAAWVIAWIQGGKADGKELLPSSYVSEAISAQMISGAGLPDGEKPGLHFSTYGFGWGMSSYKGHYRVSHGGGIDGFSADVTFFPTDSIGIIVLTNQDGSSLPPVVRNTVADRMLGLPFYDWNNEILKAMEEARTAEKAALASAVSDRKPNAPASHPLKDYTGSYTHPGYGTARVALEKDSLIIHTPAYRGLLKHYHYDVFELFVEDRIHGFDTTSASGMRIQFTGGTTGEIESFSAALQPGLDPLVFKRTAGGVAVEPASLKNYEGTYMIGQMEIKIYSRLETLYMFVAGQPEYELIPSGTDRFSIKTLSGYSVQFTPDDAGQVTALLAIQPNGTFRAEKKQ